MKSLVDKAMQAVKSFNVWDYGYFKLCLLSLGIILGAYFSPFFLNNIIAVWIIFIVTDIWLIYKVFVKYNVSKK